MSCIKKNPSNEFYKKWDVFVKERDFNLIASTYKENLYGRP